MIYEKKRHTIALDAIESKDISLLRVRTILWVSFFSPSFSVSCL